MSFIRLLVALLVLSLWALPSMAQQAAPAAPAPAVAQPAPAAESPAAAQAEPPKAQAAPLTGVAAEQDAILNRLSARVDEIDAAITANPEDDARLVEMRLQLENIQSDALESGVAFRPRLGEINAALEQLGPAPKEGEAAEPEETTARRSALTREKQQINAVLGKAEDLQIRANGLVNKISNLRRNLFSTRLLKRYDLDTAITSQVGAELQNEFQSVWRNNSSQWRFITNFKLHAALAATFFSLLAAIAFQVVGRRYVGRWIDKNPAANPAYLDRLGVAFWSTILPFVGLIVFVSLSFGLFDYFEVLRGESSKYLAGLIGVSLTTYFVYRLTHAVFSPSSPNWRLVQIESRPARWLTFLITLAALVVSLDGFLASISESLSSPLSVTIIKSLIAALIVGVILLIIARIKPFASPDGVAQPWPTWLRISLYVLGGATIISALLGYVSLAQFLSRQVVLTGAWVVTAYIGLLASRAISDEGSFGKTAIGRWMKSSYHTEDTKLDQMGVLFSVLINILIVLTFLPYVLFQWGFQPGDIVVWMRRLATGFQIGTFTFSPLAIVTGLFVFVIGWFITRWFQGWLDGTVMARGKVDVGVRNSIRSIAGYAGLALAALIAISAAGLNLSNLALIAGGLSLGIGFGLQNVVSNFVSGLILLVERPFKAGDWIIAGDVSGTVRKISVRATEIETFQRQTVIMPNSVLINGAVRNWTHRNKMGRVDIPIGVIHASDPEQVHRVLLEIARAHPLVLKNPEPFVLLAGFSDTTLNFEVRVYLADISSSSGLQNDIRFAILRAFAKEKILISNAVRDPDEPEKVSLVVDDDAAEAELIERLTKNAEHAAEQAKKPKRKPDPS